MDNEHLDAYVSARGTITPALDDASGQHWYGTCYGHEAGMLHVVDTDGDTHVVSPCNFKPDNAKQDDLP